MSIPIPAMRTWTHSKLTIAGIRWTSESDAGQPRRREDAAERAERHLNTDKVHSLDEDLSLVTQESRAAELERCGQTCLDLDDEVAFLLEKLHEDQLSGRRRGHRERLQELDQLRVAGMGDQVARLV